MTLSVPRYYFRRRGKGALVFRVCEDDRNARLEMEPIATVSGRGAVKPRGGRVLSGAEEAAIAAWLEGRADEGEPDPGATAIRAINAAADWAQREAGDGALDRATGDLLMAMHDLRAVLVRKASERG